MIDSRSTLAALAFGFGVWLIVGSLASLCDRVRSGTLRTIPRSTLGMVISHAALGVVVLGSVATSSWNTELMHTMKPGDRIDFAGYSVQLERMDEVRGPNYIAERATLNVSVGGKPYTVLQPERRLFTVQRRQVAETAIQTNLLRDFYATLGEGNPQQGWVIRLYLNPLAPWIWLGAALCALGGFVSLSDRRLRIGAPSRRPASPQAPPLQPAE